MDNNNRLDYTDFQQVRSEVDNESVKVKVVDVGKIKLNVETEVEFHLIEAILRMAAGGCAIGALDIKRVPILLDETKKAVLQLIDSMDNHKQGG